MGGVEKIVTEMKTNSKGIRFSELQKVCAFYFGKARQSESSHCIYKTPWIGDPRVNIQNNKGKAKSYQVKQVLLAIEQIEVKNGS
ncbi:MAG: toxin HicA [Methylococcales symbiont of Iophon sp. n. MRB-2018]|nr:MAG: toxin HicA [Methylococcales symbiont of Iophon sp. n. MRB-2018]KAF3978949.1 MAG: toxin HicA [Methylococcales symbiont of Iophon sp. n. MRB-2018]